jgi:RNA polymerase sigma-70 factor, ECF subfamily
MTPATQRLETSQAAEQSDTLDPGPDARRPGLRDQLIGHDRYLFALARRIVGNQSDARDLVQDTYRRALEHEDKFIVDSNLRGWLICIMRNAHRDRMRHAAFEILRPSVGEGLDGVNDLPDPGSTGVSAWRCIDDGELATALRRLPPRYRRVYRLREAGQPYDDIARQLGISTNTVATRIHRARLWLREALTRRAG